MDFQKGYNQSEFKKFLKLNLLKDSFEEINEQLPPVRKTQFFVENEIYKIGEIKDFEKEVSILQIKQKSKNDPRITLTKDTFKLMQDYSIRNALIVFWTDDNSPWRFSLLTTNFTEDFKKELSSPKRYSYILGPGEKIKTPERYLIKDGVVKNFEDLLSRFDVEVVRKEFFKLYVNLFLELYGEIQDNPTFHVLIQQKKIEPVSFAKNLMGKMIFLYFIQKKGWLGIADKSKPFGDGDPDFFKNNFDKLAHDADLFQKHSNFYNDFLEPLFYSGLNKKNPDDWHSTLNMKVPYLNGGLFEEEYEWKSTIIELNNQVFKNIITSFDTYNFTIDEDDPIDREIAVDPEMLGKIFESMISVSKDNIDDIMDVYRKAKEKKNITHPNPENILNIDIGKEINKKFGAFYTPREIVHYMTKESLIVYLTTKLHEKNQSQSEEEIESIVRKLFDYKDKHLTKQEIESEKLDGYELVKKYVFDIQEALKSVKILDPAVGSGAFPMGILQEILGLRRYLIDTFHLENETDFDIKKQIVQNSIHGVDIDPGAVDIARLRFRLSLIVDATEPVPLPNLDFKFVCANTLIPLEEGGLFVNETLINELKELRFRYFTCSNLEEKEKLKKEFKKIKESFFLIDRDKLQSLKGKDGRITESYKKAIEEMAKGAVDKKNKQILERDPFDTSKSNEWFDSQMMFGVDGFDIVIGNPPYLQLQKLSGQKIQEDYANVGYKTFTRTGDLYCLFYEIGVKLLINSGMLCYITSNKRMRAAYGELMREYFTKNTNPKLLIDLGSGVFENATVDSNILLLEKKIVTNFKVKSLNLSKETNIVNISSFENKYTIMKNLGSENWNILSLIQNVIKDKIELKGVKLMNWKINMYRGILTGLNEAFIVDEKTRQDIINIDPKSQEIIKPILRGKDIKKYGYNFAGLYLINTHNGTRGKIPRIDCEKEYPAIFNHLKKFLPAIANRQDQGDHWSNLRNCAYLEEIEREKIMYSEIVRSPQFHLDTEGFYSEATGFLITGEKVKYICGLLNSIPVTYFFKNFYAGGGLGDEGYRYKKSFLEKLPVPKPTLEQESYINGLVDKIYAKKKQNSKADTTDLEHQIDQMIYELYGLTEEEIKIVEGK